MKTKKKHLSTKSRTSPTRKRTQRYRKKVLAPSGGIPLYPHPAAAIADHTASRRRLEEGSQHWEE